MRKFLDSHSSKRRGSQCSPLVLSLCLESVLLGNVPTVASRGRTSCTDVERGGSSSQRVAKERGNYYG